MILDRELDVAVDRSAPVSPRNDFASSPLAHAAIFLALFLIALALQVLSGAYHSEFNGYPDESAHYVTSLMVRQYITAWLPGPPVDFAQNYYAHYPKVAFGHWPPFLYVVQAVWMSLFSPARASILIELALTTTVLAYSVYKEAHRWLLAARYSFARAAAACIGLLIVLIPLVQRYTAEEMSESLLTLMCFWSALYFVRYLESGRWQDNCLFGVFFALAVLTKGSGWLLALLPPVALLLTRRLRLLLSSSFWIAPFIVGVTCIPWQLMTMRLVAEGWQGGSHPSVAYSLTALVAFARLFLQILGPALLLLAIVGIFSAVLLPMFKRPVSPAPAVMFALILADWIFHSLVPAGIEDRKLIIAIPALVLFVLAGVLWLAGRIPVPLALTKWRVPALALLAAISFCAVTFAIPRERHYGYIEAARYITSRPELRSATILVSSESGGEGPFVAEVSMREPAPKAVILRATKTLAEVSFDADVYRQIFPDAPSVLAFLDAEHVSVVVLDTFPAHLNFPHDQLLRQLVGQSGRFRLLAAFPGGSAAAGEVQVYRVQPPK